MRFGDLYPGDVIALFVTEPTTWCEISFIISVRPQPDRQTVDMTILEFSHKRTGDGIRIVDTTWLVEHCKELPREFNVFRCGERIH